MPTKHKHRRVPQPVEPFVENTLPEIRSGGCVEDRNAMIADTAYFRAEKRHFVPGHELEDWLAAEQEVDARLGQIGPVAQGH